MVIYKGFHHHVVQADKDMVPLNKPCPPKAEVVLQGLKGALDGPSIPRPVEGRDVWLLPLHLKRAKQGETHALAMRVLCSGEQSLSVSASQANNTLTVPF